MTVNYLEVWGFDQLMATAAVRYCLGRQSYIVGACTDWVIENWNNFDVGAQECIIRHAEDAFKRDDEIREETPGELFALPLGMNSNRRQWEEVRKLWSQETLEG